MTEFELHAITNENALTTKRELAKFDIPVVEAMWEDLLKRLRQTDADLFKAEGDHRRALSA